MRMPWRRKPKTEAQEVAAGDRLLARVGEEVALIRGDLLPAVRRAGETQRKPGLLAQHLPRPAGLLGGLPERAAQGLPVVP